MGKIFFSIVLAFLIFFSFGQPVYAGACVPGSDGVTYNCQCLVFNESTNTCDYMDCHTGFCCEDDNTCPVSSFPPGTLIKTPVGSVKIEELKVGDIVTSFKEDNILDSKIRKIFKYERDFYYSLSAGDYSVKASAEHPFYIGGGEFKVISKLVSGDTVYVLENDKLVSKTVTSNTKIDKSTPVYNLTVDNTNTYFAGGFAVQTRSLWKMHKLTWAVEIRPLNEFTLRPITILFPPINKLKPPSPAAFCWHSAPKTAQEA